MTRDQQKTVLVTGGAGYIGSHTVVLLLQQEYKVVVIDNCANAYFNQDNDDFNGTDENGNIMEDKKLTQLPESLRRVEIIANKKLAAFFKFDLVNDFYNGNLDRIFREFNICAVIHFAALKSLNESISKPLEYYTNNLIGTINLLNCMKRHGCRQMIFSSSATVYGLPQYTPVDEQHQFGQNVLNPYGRTKCMVEQILNDLCASTTTTNKSLSSPNDGNNVNNVTSSQQKWNIIALRYFNPVGAHPSGHIGEHTIDVPNNLMPYVSQVAVKKREKLFVFGNDFDTHDGTGVRDYIHIMDLANGHIHALESLISNNNNNNYEGGYKTYNLGTGKGYSVLEMINTFEEVNNVKIPYEIIGRREGDAGEVYADASLALKELNWSAKYSLTDMCRDTFRWQTNYPEGFKTPMKQ